MTGIHQFLRTCLFAGALVPLLVITAPLVQAQTPAQLPLLTKAGPAVAPNVMLTLDDSGSMQFQHMPEDEFAPTNIAPIPNPVGSAQVRIDKGDIYQTSFLRGTVPGNIASTNYVLKALRSTDTNTIFYNPEFLYKPWLTSDGVTRLPASPVATAYIDPLVRTLAAGTFVNLTATSAVAGRTFVAATAMVGGTQYRIETRSVDGSSQTNFTNFGAANNNVGTVFTKSGGAGTGNGIVSRTNVAGTDPTGWCYANAPTNPVNTTGNTTSNGCMAVGSFAGGYTFTHDPGVYFRLNKSGGNYLAVTNAANYTGYSINGAVFFPKVAERTDCTGAVGPTGCTQAQERQNFANWFTYYRTRNLLARGSLMEAFGVEAAPVAAGNFVIGNRYAIVTVGSTSFTSIGAAANTVDTVFTATGAGAGTGTARSIAMRLGFGSINQNSGGAVAVDGVNTKVLESDTATYGSGAVREFSAARKANLFKWLEDLPASGGTPLVTALETVGNYYSRTDNKGPWTDFPGAAGNTVANNKTCRRSYNIMMTDGYWNGAVVAVGNQDGTNGTTITGVGASYQYIASKPFSDTHSNTLADVAMKYWKTDLQPATTNAVPPVAENTSFWQNMTSFTIGLGVKGDLDPATDLPALTAGTKSWGNATAGGTTANVDDLWHAAVNSRGKYFSAKDPQELSTAIRTALAGATGGAGATAGVATAASLLSSNNRKYIPRFNPGIWDGEVQAYALDASGVATTVSTWDATSKMPAFGSRNVVTFDNTPTTWAGTTFSWSALPTAARTAMGSVATTYTTQFIDYLKGDHSLEGTGNPFRSRINAAGVPFVLGDIVNSNPVLIKSNFDGAYTDPLFGGATAYAAFKATKAARTPVLFAGSNDGMLHGFQDTLGVTPSLDGQEIFAYVPRAVYSNLSKLADKTYGVSPTLQHQYFVDGPMNEADAYVNAPGASTPSWRNYLFGSLGAGGRAVFALDVTNSTSMTGSNVRWELSDSEDSDIGYVMTPVKVGVLANGRWVAIFGNGFSSTSGRAVLFVVDIENAASSNASIRAGAIQKLVLEGITGTNGLGGVTLIPNRTSGRTEFIYAGDKNGTMWKMKYDASTNAFVKDTISPAGLFNARDSGGNPQPITASPAVFAHPQSNVGGYMVLFGTGKLFAAADSSDTSTQSVYAVWDKDAGPSAVVDTVPRPLARANLIVRNLTAFSGTGGASGTTFYAVSGSSVNYGAGSLQRGWYMDLSPAITGGRVIYPAQVVGYATALLSSVAPVQGTPAACVSGDGSALNVLVSVDGEVPTNRFFDTNGDGVIDGSDALSIGYETKADGVDAVVSSAGTSGGNRLTDIGGGGPAGDCTGATCSKKGQKCAPSPACPEPNTCLASIQSATMGLAVCIPVGSGGTRVWRRIINPPIR